MVKVFYHNDADGRCSAFWVRKYLESSGISFTKEDFIEMNYDKEFPWNKVHSDELVFMVDFCLNNPQDMINLSIECDFVWIDHHKTAIDKMQPYLDGGVDMKGYASSFKGIRQDDVAACLLTWSYLNKRPIAVDAPLFTQYIHLWDTWQWKQRCFEERFAIECFITCLTSYDCHPLDEVWDNLYNDATYCGELVNHGCHMLDYRNGYAKDLCNSIGKTIEFEGIKCFACNMAHVSSEWFKSVDESTYDVLMPFYYNMNTNMFSVSLYGKGDIDVSKIAVKHGGGGHFGSAGFQLKSLPF